MLKKKSSTSSVLRTVVGWGVVGAVAARWLSRLMPPGTTPDSLIVTVEGPPLGEGADVPWTDVQITINGPSGTQTAMTNTAAFPVTLTASGTYTINVSDVSAAKDAANAPVNLQLHPGSYVNWTQITTQRTGIVCHITFRYKQI